MTNKLYIKTITKCAMCPEFRAIGLSGTGGLCATLDEVIYSPATIDFDPYTEVYKDCPLVDFQQQWDKGVK